MNDTSLFQLANSEHEQCYRVSVLSEASPSEQGIRYRGPDGTQMLPWRTIQAALAGEVGEHEGVRTIIFDLVIDRVITSRGVLFSICRLSAEPGEEAMNLAGAITSALGDNARQGIKTLAAEGCSSLWYPDLEEFEVAAVQSLTR